ncbi:MAG: hypothetical protein A2X02_04665 [Bacteroidetes bacterium GWF2_29_10]|nr:MAG: hypothetical protein A2X02_04665 [Bacteroidetes bacterium GWF2_29_10]HBY21695.1 hypothetical protein [Clostridiales bacterium]
MNELYVIKLGSNCIVKDTEESEINDKLFTNLAIITKQILENGDKVAIVTSGAIAIGKSMLGIKEAKSV